MLCKGCKVIQDIVSDNHAPVTRNCPTEKQMNKHQMNSTSSIFKVNEYVTKKQYN